MTRRWKAGDHGETNGIRWRVVKGKKSPDDLRLDIYLDGQWVPAQMSWGMLLADFFCENEDVLYPPPAAGGGKYLGAMWKASRNGWRAAVDQLHVEQAAKRLREMQEFEQDGRRSA